MARGRSRSRRRQTRRKQRGGDNSGALVQLAPVSAATAGLAGPPYGNVQATLQGRVHDLLATTFGPNQIQQFGGRRRKGSKRRSRKQTKRRRN
jgi:hypothetical protein